ncbi:hypothetical protein KFK09_017427 [Dendrobium nobile]|uniref:Uncharacterized protein n=1 Tax=Dendrobium nobile TaxID=94219 RepID=A0A8T3B2H3_DENNO|nr:hypothetical protein KFK09_017427 [Dendrobium nobile]
MRKVKSLKNKFIGNNKYCVFPLLEVQHVERSEALQYWFEVGVAAEDECLLSWLIEMVLSYYLKLKEFTPFPSKLKSLKIEDIGWKTLNRCSISNSISLKNLEFITVKRSHILLTYLTLNVEIRNDKN